VALAAYLAIQQIESNLLEPLVMEKAASIHPVGRDTRRYDARFGVRGF
jgi:hypothetical protein